MIIRFLEILLLTTRHATEFCIRAGYLCLRRRRHECGRVLGESVARLCEAVGPTLIKVGRILSARRDLLPATMGPRLLRLQDQMAPFDGARIPGIVESAFGRPLSELFDSFDLAPVASASI